MEKKHRKLINDNFHELVNVTNRIDEVIQKFPKHKNDYMLNYLNGFTEDKARRREFYEMIQGRGPRAFDYLVTALRVTKNFRAEELINREKIASYVFSEDEIADPKKSENTSHINLSTLGLDETDLVDVDEVSEIVVKKHPLGKFMDVDEENQPGGTYRMRSRPRGLALLINIYKTAGHDDRRGSEVDLKKLCKVFTSLGYEVEKYSDLYSKEMKDKIKLFSLSSQLKKVDSLVVFIMCHGQGYRGSVDLLASDGECVNSDWVIKQFVTDERTDYQLKDRKPKMFFFQACRPLDPDHKNVRWTKRADSDDNFASRRDVFDYNSESGRSSLALSYEDTYVVFSTISGYLSMRDPQEGSWFVKAFCDVVAKNAWICDLDSMLGMVHEEVRKKDCEFGNQTLEIVKKGVSKRVYFNPFLFED